MKNKNLDFQINSLRLDQIVTALQVIALCFFSVIVFLFLPILAYLFPISQEVLTYTSVAVLAIGIAYTLFALIGNLFRQRSIKQLETRL